MPPHLRSYREYALRLAAILKPMKIDRMLLGLGALLISLAVLFVVIPWFANVLDVIPTEAPEQMPESIARLIAGAIALVSLTAASYLALKERKEAKHRRSKTSEEGHS